MVQKLRKAASPAIDPKDPWGDDIFARKRAGVMLSEMIAAVDQTFVIAVNGGWGSGKTVFLMRLAAHLHLLEPRIHTVYVNAWENDWNDDPLLSLVLATHQTLEAAGYVKVSDVGARLVGHALELAAPLTSVAAHIIAPGSGSVAGGVVKAGTEAIKNAANRNRAKRDLESSLAEARDLLLRRKPGRPFSGHVVIIVDELDRCRPDYAIRMLERIKHLYSIPGFIFVIATDNTNLRSAVKSVYGPEIDGEKYLRKFFDFEMSLRRPSTEQFTAALKRQFSLDTILGDEADTLAQRLRNGTFPTGTNPSTAQLWIEALDEYQRSAERLGLSLRDQSQAFSLLYAMMATHGKRESFLPPVAGFLACLRFGDEHSFDRVKKGGFVALREVINESGDDVGTYLKTLSKILEREPDRWVETIANLQGSASTSSAAERIGVRTSSNYRRNALIPTLEDMIFMVGDSEELDEPST